MQPSIKNIRKELEGLYPPEEIDGFIRLIFAHLKNYSLTEIYVNIDQKLVPKEVESISKVVSRLKNQEPIQYILGEAGFYGLTFKVTPDVLIPRPETEELVDLVLKSKRDKPTRILDVGTGSGCIPVSLKKNWPHAHVMACDISERAIKVAQINAGLNQTEVAFFHLNILDPLLPASFPKIDLLVSNPPYVTESEKKLMGRNVLHFEPERALFVPDDDPLLFYTALAGFARKYLNQDGQVFWEINEAFGKDCANLLKENGFINVKVRKDINGKNRMVFAEFKNAEN
jgi:release factor glutamine methyltransferase